MVAGITALMFAADPDLTTADARQILYETATDLGDPDYDPYFGWGLVNASYAVYEVKNRADLLWPPIVDVSAGGYHSLFLRKDGTIQATGLNSDGQLGDGTTVSRATFGQVTEIDEYYGEFSDLEDVRFVEAGYYYNYVIRSDGRAFSWGCNTYGELGNCCTGRTQLPVAVSFWY